MDLGLRVDHDHTYIFAPEGESLATVEWFEPERLAPQHIIGSAKGRGNTLFLKQEPNGVVLRRYRRAGAAAFFSKTHYLRVGLLRSRPYQELLLTWRLYQMGLPVPKALAARITHHFLTYEAALLTEEIPHAYALEDLSDVPWSLVGVCVAKFHRAGLFHADLNIRNILADHKGGVWLIDFDKCAFRVPSRIWQQANMDRLKRSLHKRERFAQQGWRELLEAYHDTLGEEGSR